jgi:hypothetical protein
MVKITGGLKASESSWRIAARTTPNEPDDMPQLVRAEHEHNLIGAGYVPDMSNRFGIALNNALARIRADLCACMRWGRSPAGHRRSGAATKVYQATNELITDRQNSRIECPT